ALAAGAVAGTGGPPPTVPSGGVVRWDAPAVWSLPAADWMRSFSADDDSRGSTCGVATSVRAMLPTGCRGVVSFRRDTVTYTTSAAAADASGAMRNNRNHEVRSGCEAWLAPTVAVRAIAATTA